MRVMEKLEMITEKEFAVFTDKTVDEYMADGGQKHLDAGFVVNPHKAVKTWDNLEDAFNSKEAQAKFEGFQAEPYEVERRNPERFKFVKAYLLENGNIFYSYIVENVTLMSECSLGSGMYNSGFNQAYQFKDGFVVLKQPKNMVFSKDLKHRKELAKMSYYGSTFVDTVLGL